MDNFNYLPKITGKYLQKTEEGEQIKSFDHMQGSKPVAE
jgi:hypothetical protein